MKTLDSNKSNHFVDNLSFSDSSETTAFYTTLFPVVLKLLSMHIGTISKGILFLRVCEKCKAVLKPGVGIEGV